MSTPVRSGYYRFGVGVPVAVGLGVGVADMHSVPDSTSFPGRFEVANVSVQGLGVVINGWEADYKAWSQRDLRRETLRLLVGRRRLLQRPARRRANLRAGPNRSYRRRHQFRAGSGGLCRLYFHRYQRSGLQIPKKQLISFHFLSPQCQPIVLALGSSEELPVRHRRPYSLLIAGS